ncbi:MAG: hypothetical protein QM688_01895 [Sphingomonas bacterium]
MKAVLATTLAALLAACSGHSAGNEAAAANAQAPADNVQDYGATVAALPPGQQGGVFLRAIRDSDLPCQDIVDVERLPDQNGQKVWRATCENGVQHLIQIGKGGIANVTSLRSN